MVTEVASHNETWQIGAVRELARPRERDFVEIVVDVDEMEMEMRLVRSSATLTVDESFRLLQAEPEADVDVGGAHALARP
jgi:hypothetical protein